MRGGEGLLSGFEQERPSAFGIRSQSQ